MNVNVILDTINSVTDTVNSVKETIKSIIDQIVNFLAPLNATTILLNFFVFVVILAWIVKSFKIGQKLENAAENVKETIKASENAVEESVKNLMNADEAVKNIENELEEISKEGDKNAELLETKINNETEKQVSSIGENAQKIINANNADIISNLSKKTSIASIELAKKHIKEILKKKPQYHQQFIDESIKEIETGLK